jgi:hypothetical protein
MGMDLDGRIVHLDVDDIYKRVSKPDEVQSGSQVEQEIAAVSGRYDLLLLFLLVITREIYMRLKSGMNSMIDAIIDDLKPSNLGRIPESLRSSSEQSM